MASFTKIATDQERTVGRGARAYVFLGVMVVLLWGAIGGRLVYLQLITGSYNRQLAENNRIRLIPKPPERGRIYDRHSRILATNRLAYAIYAWPIAQTELQWQPIIEKLAQVTGMPSREIRQKIAQAGYQSPNLVKIASNISPRLITYLAEHSSEFPGIQVEPEAVRYYPNGDVAAHVLGYTGEITDSELAKRQDKGYRLGDIVGKMGAEFAFEEKLRGSWGGQQVEVDSMERVIQVLGQKPPIPGGSIQLTIDLELQKAAERALGYGRGAAVVLNPHNGEILAMVSRPSFDPNVFSTPISQATWERLNSEDKPFVNRALQGFPPASTFKIITTIAGLESGKFTPASLLPTYPYLDLGGLLFWDHNQAGFGTIGFAEALAYSSNTFFAQVGMTIGIEELVKWCQRLGLGEPSGIELAREEAEGLLPTPQWKWELLREPWYIGDTVNLSIGQGDLQATVLQMAVVTAAIANGGYRVRPHLLLDKTTPPHKQPIGLQPTTIEVVRRGLEAVTTFGTGAGLSTVIPFAGKSGTAEDPPRPTHAWFTAYAPVANPQIVVTVFVENAGKGGSAVAGPIVAEIINAYAQRQ
ncbi:MAG: penicillin-binding protein 2 [Pseudanabaenaceae cyanobacterium SKYGB_i_bin29]|nr:penicillin-binding protein 2 [Pseudanabaenaceae cyanobacterium SKYG29]MDW8420550.1 penicillin-binding protein 2 [Pseudanabaenaceae cyanobacterium SKYGB_i_bin29]